MKLNHEELSLIHLALVILQVEETESVPRKLSNYGFDQLQSLLDRLLIEMKK
jgi:hypothetical protein